MRSHRGIPLYLLVFDRPASTLSSSKYRSPVLGARYLSAFTHAWPSWKASHLSQSVKNIARRLSGQGNTAGPLDLIDHARINFCGFREAVFRITPKDKVRLPRRPWAAMNTRSVKSNVQNFSSSRKEC